MIDIADLTFGYGDDPPVFEKFNWQVDRGEAWSIIGPSGCGKTTLLYLLAGLYYPLSGTIHIDGSAITQPRPRSGLVLQDHGLLPWATVRRNTRLGLTIREFYGSDGRHAPADEELDTIEIDRRVSDCLKKLGIQHLENHYPLQLSRGQRQRTAIARTLVTQPDLLMLDEPFSALDAPTRDDLQRFVFDIHEDAALTYIIVTHDIETAVGMGKKILVLNKGVNRNPQIIANESAGTVDYRFHMDFRGKCDELHKLLGTLL